MDLLKFLPKNFICMNGKNFKLSTKCKYCNKILDNGTARAYGVCGECINQ